MDTLATQNFDLAIEGMSCASCVARVEKALGRVEGVRDVAVNLATGTAHLRAGPATSLAALLIAASRAGYAAAPNRATPPPAGTEREIKTLYAGALLAVPLFAAMVLPIPGLVQLLLATPIQFWLGARFYAAAYKALRARAANMDLLVALGTTAAYLLSLAELVAHGQLYFESAAAVILFVRFGRFLEARAKLEAAGAVKSLEKLRPAKIHVEGRGTLALAELRVGDVLRVRPGERVAADGVILSGSGSLDESMITGESLPVMREPGARVLAGSLNLEAGFRIRVTAPAGESFLDRIGRLIAAAQGSKTAGQRLVDRVAAVFVPAVLGIALLTCAGWLLAGAAPPRAIINAVSVLVIACPCALGLATPAAILAGTTAAARLGILVRNAAALEAACGITLVVFDKTGTLTQGQPKLSRLQLLGSEPEAAVWQIAASLAALDTHPLSHPLRQHGVLPAEDFVATPGQGVTGTVVGERYRLGSAAFTGVAFSPEAGPETWSYLATAAGEPLAAFGFADAPRAGAAAAISRLHARGIKTLLLTGDNAQAAEAVGRALGLGRIVAGASPEQKLAQIQSARAAGEKVAMVGDGVNDAAALAAADLGLAIGAGADVTIEAADISLLRPDPGLVPDTLELALQTLRVLRAGLFWAVIYNAVAIPAAAFGLLSPTLAGAAMAASSVSVLGNALRLRHWKPA